ncbi:S66 peptidase family protein [Marinifilum caeruleilacunae]|uniref:LD-carboxypeptidase n=1 Tax=Marinifilum caeruleilacunae TaxID=2499076 RepID=A0ABX1WXP0_9BACT|nr:LD-carboxypeptidase [Marinifilum caeruleilacunae]NOU60862.1 LD-carboxypeptidase [Marinifilum caeruleilacunae]
MYQPAALQKGDKIGIISPAGKIDPEKVGIAVTKLEDLGLKVVLGKHVFDEYHQFAGRDLNRLKDLQQMLDDPEIKAILCARGGYGCVRILEYVDFDLFLRKPKWIVGYSDITVFHSYLNNILEVESLHSVMPINFLDDESGKSVQSMFDGIMGKVEDYQIPSNDLNRLGVAEGELIGGNLSILYSLRGTIMDFETHGKILFIEDVGEELYHLDRMMNNLRMGGKLSELQALVVGGFSLMKEGEPKFGKTAYEIIQESVSNYSFPVVYGFPAGHINDNWTLPLGRYVKINVDVNEVKFTWH